MNKKRVLIVEDTPELAKVLARELGLDLYDVGIAEDGEKALEAVRTHHYDLILLDMVLPKNDGLSVLRSLRQMPEYKKTPIFAITNLDDKTVQKACEGYAVARYYVKSEITLNKLLENIDAALLSGDHEKV